MGKLSKYLALLIVVSVSSFGPCAAAGSKLDVRLLIDVSGSMKTNDPENVRIPAVGLVAELMPPGATAGIWMFAERVEQLMAPREVDSQWKKSASKLSKKIHSGGQFTGIEAAISQSTRTWLSDPDSDRAMHLILLTDGVVDAAKDAVINAQSRDRILNSMLAQLAQSGVKIHTVALSENADRELLTSLAETTAAWSEQVDDAASLQRAFLHMFEQAASPDSLPLNDKQFEVDSSISEMSLLIFHSPSAEPLQLTSPTGEVFDAGHVNGELQWRVEDGYELVTVTAPKVGTWQINADPDPDNRVLIVTDVKLAVRPLPSNFVVNDSLTIDAGLTEQGTPIVREDFLKILNARAEISNSEKSNPIEIPLTLDEAHASFSAKRVVDCKPVITITS
ncbi:MAG: VWA domain-containing protein [Proteobacteria bacterium]|nr:VWA domain-containing protein [Pseudomonadota bacterium]